MAAMAGCFDVLHLDDSLFVSYKDVKKQGSLRYYLLSAFLAMVEIFRALHSLWVTLLPFALLWWNVMLYAMCSKYYSGNRSRLWLQAAGRHFSCNTMQESCVFSEASIAEEEEARPSPHHQGGLSADASHVTENREMSIVSLCRPGECAEAVHGVKKDVGFPSHPQRKPPHGFGVAVVPFPTQSVLHALDGDSVVAALCLEESCPRHPIQVEEQIPCEATSHALDVEAVSASSHTSKLSSLSFLEERGSQVRRSAKDCHWAACSSLSPHQGPPLSMIDFCQCPLISSERPCLQINLDRNCDMLHFKGPVCFDHVSVNWSMLREQLQIFNESCVLGLNYGKKCRNLEWGFTKVSTSQARNDNYAILQFILSTADGLNTFSIISSYGTAENVKLWIRKQQSLSDFLSGFQMKNNIAYVDSRGRSSNSSEDIHSVRCSSIKSDDEGDSTYCTSTQCTTDRDDGLEYTDVVYDTQCYGDDRCCCYECCHGIEDIAMDSVGDTEGAHGSFVRPATDEGDRFYDCSALCCNVVYDNPYCGTDVDGICSMDYDAGGSGYTIFDSNVEASGAVLGDFHVAYKDGVRENAVEIYVANPNTWWDEDAVVVEEKETEEGGIEDEWQVV